MAPENKLPIRPEYALFAFYPVHVRASATSLAEAPYALAFFAGLLAFLVYRGRSRAGAGWLVLSAACFTAAAMLRFEAWLFYPVLCLFAIRRGLLKAVAFGAMLALFPAWHMYVCWKTTGNPLSFAVTSSASFLLYLPRMSLAYRATAWPAAFWNAMSPPLAIFAAAGLFWAALARKGGFLVAMLALPYALLSYRTLQGMIDPALLRYSLVLAAFLIPLAGGALVGLALLVQVQIAAHEEDTAGDAQHLGGGGVAGLADRGHGGKQHAAEKKAAHV